MFRSSIFSLLAQEVQVLIKKQMLFYLGGKSQVLSGIVSIASKFMEVILMSTEAKVLKCNLCGKEWQVYSTDHYNDGSCPSCNAMNTTLIRIIKVN